MNINDLSILIEQAAQEVAAYRSTRDHLTHAEAERIIGRFARLAFDKMSCDMTAAQLIANQATPEANKAD